MSSLIFRHSDGIIPNLLAPSYAVSGYAIGQWLKATGSLPVAILANLWFAHALIIAAYLFHKFAHDNFIGAVSVLFLTAV